MTTSVNFSRTMKQCSRHAPAKRRHQRVYTVYLPVLLITLPVICYLRGYSLNPQHRRGDRNGCAAGLPPVSGVKLAPHPLQRRHRK
ncbi:hypothetical protein KCP71_05445 [Salmonella enterica subsp. enterica]|nr:hypothetical protein KCP71_05445 [Salmonella enterica subsp. enterica]